MLPILILDKLHQFSIIEQIIVKAKKIILWKTNKIASITLNHWIHTNSEIY